MLRRQNFPGLPRALTAAALIVLATTIAATLTTLATPTHAGWLSRLTRTASDAPDARTPRGLKSIDDATTHLKSLPPDTTTLAAHLSPEGHWTLVNRKGERVTAASDDELKRAVAILAPDAAKSGDKSTLYLTEDTLFAPRARFDDLPATASLRAIISATAMPLHRIGKGDTTRLLAEIRPNLFIEAAERRAFHETVFHLARTLDRPRLRVLSVDPDAPGVLSSTPRMDPDTGRALVDIVAPDALISSIATLRRQTVILVARRDGDHLVVKPSTGAEIRYAASEIAAAAKAADVNLIVFHATSPVQPGGRNWFFIKTGVRGLEDEAGAPTLSDLVSALTGPSRRLTVTARTIGPDQTILDIAPAKDFSAPVIDYSRVVDIVKGMVAEFAGQTAVLGAELIVRSADRQRELDTRIIPGLSSDLQFGYIALLLLGWFGSPISRGWWQSIWPQESRADYPGRIGYHLAAVVRSLAFWTLFAPLTAALSAPLQILSRGWYIITTPVRLWRRLRPPKTA